MGYKFVAQLSPFTQSLSFHPYSLSYQLHFNSLLFFNSTQLPNQHKAERIDWILEAELMGGRGAAAHNPQQTRREGLPLLSFFNQPTNSSIQSFNLWMNWWIELGWLVSLCEEKTSMQPYCSRRKEEKESNQSFNSCFWWRTAGQQNKNWLISLTALPLGAPFSQTKHSPLIVFLLSFHSIIIPINSRSVCLASFSLNWGWFVCLPAEPITHFSSRSGVLLRKPNQPASLTPFSN